MLEYKGLRYDGYRAAHGYNPEHPFSKAREKLYRNFLFASRNGTLVIPIKGYAVFLLVFRY